MTEPSLYISNLLLSCSYWFHFLFSKLSTSFPLLMFPTASGIALWQNAVLNKSYALRHTEHISGFTQEKHIQQTAFNNK